MFKRLFIVGSVLLILYATAFADETGGKVSLGLKGGTAHYYGDFTNSAWDSYVDATITWWLIDQLGLNFTYGRGHLRADESQANYFKTWNYSYAFMLRYKPKPSLALNPYLAVGFEWFDIDPKARNGHRTQSFARGMANSDFQKVNNALPVGIGFSYFLTDWLSLDAEGLLHISFIDYVDGYEAGSKNDNWITLAAGLSIYIGKPKDTDGDGIVDKDDGDYLHPEDFDGFQDEDGIPDLDNDQDGIPDKLDKAPNEPEDKDGFQDNDGVPDLDNDNDGILDVNDKAPNQAEDKDGFQDEDGVPDPDNDNDGIVDAQDQCPDEAETMNGYEDDDGCPDTKPEIAVEKGKAIVLEGVNFKTGSAELLPESIPILEKVVKTLKENPEIVVEIRGYTDNTGSYKANMKLSQARADAVRMYLIRNGISPDRVSAKGYGPENPIAPNDTKEGRAKNRRVEFFRIK